jgi:HK97 family phage portal protein
MGIVKRVKSELRSSLENPSVPLAFGADWLVNGIGMGNRTASGVRVNEITAMNIPAVFACVKRISEDVASLPLRIYEKLQPRGNKLADNLDLFDLLHSAPNREMTSYTWRETSQAHVLLWGNLYTEIQRDNANRPVALWPRHPSKTKPRRNSAGEIEYVTSDGMANGVERTIAAVDMLHVPGLGWDGLVGMSVVHMAAQSMGLSIATEAFGAKFFGNGAQPGGVLSHPEVLDPLSRENLKKSWQEANGGDRQGGIALLEEGVKFTTIGIAPEASQFLQTRQFQVSEIARWFAMPLHMLSDLSKSTHSNIEQQAIEYVQSCLRPWLVRWEQEIIRKLFPSGKPAGEATLGRHANKKYFPTFDLDGLLRGDFATRWAGYQIALNTGVMCPNVVAEKENLNPIAKEDGGDAYRVALNLVPAPRWLEPPPEPGAPATAAAKGTTPKTDDTTDDEQEDTPGSGNSVETNSLNVTGITTSYSRLFRDAFDRSLRKDKADSLVLYRTLAPVLLTIADALATQAATEMRLKAAPTAAITECLNDYVLRMTKRTATWTAETADVTAPEELQRAARAITAFVYRESATQKSKELQAAKPKEETNEQ